MNNKCGNKYTCKFEDCLDDAHYVRETVFIREQKFEIDKDETDYIAQHVVLYNDSKPIATARAYKAQEDGNYHIGRVAVIKEYRGKGVGKMVMDALEEKLSQQGIKVTYLSSQINAKGFYISLGYEAYGNEYYDEHCLHIAMKKMIGVN